MEIKIACDVKDSVKLDQLEPFQGELKNLNQEDYERLRKEIIQTGFAFPVYVWKDKGKHYIIGGHQRVRTLKEMSTADDAHLPDDMVPVVFIQADSYKSAKHRVLQDVSQYGSMQRQGLYEFMLDAEMDIESMVSSFKFPDIDLKGFNEEYFKDLDVKTADGSRELNESDFSNFKHKCPRCSFEFDDDKKNN